MIPSNVSYETVAVTDEHDLTQPSELETRRFDHRQSSHA